MDIHQQGSQLLQHRQGGVAAVHQHHAASATGELAGNDDLSLSIVYGLPHKELMKFLRHFLKRKDRLDAQPVTTCAYHVSGNALAQDGSQRIYKYGFARTGLAGQDIEARSELHLDVFQQSEVPNCQSLQHALRSSFFWFIYWYI